MVRRRSSYGAYLADGLWREGCAGLQLVDPCPDCREVLDLLVERRDRARVVDTYRRVVMRHQMRVPMQPMPRGPRQWRRKR